MRKEPIFDESQIDALGAYVQANGGGPTVERNADGSIAMSSLRGNDLGRGGDLFRLNCASCHNFTGKGGALSSGKFAPPLEPANEQQILSRDAHRAAEHAEVLRPSALVRCQEGHHRLRQERDRDRSQGGNGLGGFGPAPEGMAMWIIGMVALIGAALWIGAGHDARRDDAQRSDEKERRPMTDEHSGTQPTEDELNAMSREELVAARRQARRRRDRLQGAALAGRGHQGREARRAPGRHLAAARRFAGLALLLVVLVLAVGVPAGTARRATWCTRWPRRCTA